MVERPWVGLVVSGNVGVSVVGEDVDEDEGVDYEGGLH